MRPLVSFRACIEQYIPVTPVVTPAPTPSPTASATLEPTATPVPPDPSPTPGLTLEPTATPTSPSLEPSPPPEPRLLFADDFSLPSSGWTVGHSALATKAYNGGEYRVAIHTPGRFSTGNPPFRGRDVSIEVDARFASTAYGTYGITFGTTENASAYYYLMVTAYQEFCLFKIVDGQFTALVPLSPAANIRAGMETNRLAVRRHGEHIWLYANGVELAHVLDGAASVWG